MMKKLTLIAGLLLAGFFAGAAIICKQDYGGATSLTTGLALLLLPWLHPCLPRLSPFLSCGVVLFSLSCIFFRCLAFASRSLPAQGRLKGRKFKSGL